jgi:hypothetical protein
VTVEFDVVGTGAANRPLVTDHDPDFCTVQGVAPGGGARISVHYWGGLP